MYVDAPIKLIISSSCLVQIQLYKSSFENNSKYRELLEKSPAKQQLRIHFSDEVNLVLVINNQSKVMGRGVLKTKLFLYESSALSCGEGSPAPISLL